MEERIYFIQHVSLQDEFLGNKGRGITHRSNETKCNTKKALGMKYKFDWNGIQNEEKRFKEKGMHIRRCTDCFHSSLTSLVPKGEAFDEQKFRKFMEEKLNFISRYIERYHGSPNKWEAQDEKGLEDRFKSVFLSEIVFKIDSEYNFDMLTRRHRWDLLRVTRDQLINFLRSYKTTDQKIYELFRRQIQEHLIKSQFVNNMEKYEKLNREWYENSFPTYNNEACSKLNSLISSIYASYGIISCNGRNHPFFCFCGFGGTRISAASDSH